MSGIELETESKTDLTTLPILVGLVGSIGIEYLYYGIDDTDTPTKKVYQLDESTSN